MSARATAARMAITFVAYLAAAWCGVALSAPHVVATFWPPNAVLLALLVRADGRLWPYLLLATCPANLAINWWLGQPAAVSVAYWIVNAAEALVMAALLRRLHGRVTLGRFVEMTSFIVLAALCTMGCAGVGAALTLVWNPGLHLPEVWRSWWAADLLGMIAIAPVIISAPASLREARAGATRECALFGVVMAVFVGAAGLAPSFGVDPRRVLQPVAVPLLGWAALRLNVAGTSWAMMALSLVVVTNHLRGHGELVGPLGFTADRAVLLQIILSGLTATFLSIAAATHEGREQERKLRQRDAGRLALVAAMTHEIRNPLSVILASVEMAETPGSASLGTIERAARQILEVVDDTLAAAQRDDERAGPEPVRLPVLWRNLYADCEAMTRAPGVALDWHAAPEATFMIERQRVVTMLRNLVRNALKFTDRGRVEVACRIDDANVTFVVTDTGIGIPIEEQQRIFGLYERGAADPARRRPGTGVGLYLVRKYAEECGGSISLESAPGQGSRFTLVLPCSAAVQRVA